MKQLTMTIKSLAMAVLLSALMVAIAQSEKTLVVAVAGEIQTLDNDLSSTPRATETGYNIYTALVDYGTREVSPGAFISTYEWVPELAESWTIEGDPPVFTFKLREGLTFPGSGNEVTAEDIVYKFSRKFNLRPWNMTNYAIMDEDSWVALDRYTVQVTTGRYSPFTNTGMAMWSGRIFDSEVLKEQATADDPWATTWVRNNYAGAGPYALESYIPGEIAVFVRNDDYWGEPAYYQRIEFRVIPSGSSRMLLLRAGEVDIVRDAPIRELLALRSDPNINVVSIPSTNKFNLIMNTQIAPFDNVLVRQAISHAIPYDAIVSNVFQGQAQRFRSPVAFGNPGYDDSAWNYDGGAERARELLAEAGYPEGFDVELSLDQSFGAHEQTAILLQSALADVGIRVTINQLNSAAYAEQLGQRQLAFFLHEILGWIRDPGYDLDVAFWPGGFANYGQYGNERVTELIQEANSTVDETARMALLSEAQRLVIEDAPVAFLAQPNFMIAMRQGIENFVLYPDHMIRYFLLREAE